jgi:hypothetical protein
MDARWMPLFAAAVGVVGGVGGAWVGGGVANEGQQQRSQSERAAAIQDLRIEVYGDFLGTAQEVWASVDTGRREAVQGAKARLFAAEGRVVLVHENEGVREAAVRLRQVLDSSRPTSEQQRKQRTQDYAEAANTFREVARDDIAESGD